MKEFLEKIKKELRILTFILIIVILIWLFLYYRNNFFKEFILEFTKFYFKFIKVIEFPFLKIWNVTLSLINIIISILIIYIWLKLAFLYKKLIFSFRRKYKDRLSYWTATILANIGYYFIIFIVGFSSLKFIWLDFSSLTLIAWALSVWIWFWLKNIISNFISGIILIFEKSIKVWDYVELADKTRWTVVDIRIRSTTVKTNNNIDLIIPNQNFIDTRIINWTLNDHKVRFKIPFWVAYWTKIKDIEKTIIWALKESNLNYMKSWDYTPVIVMKQMWNSSIDFELYVWVRWDDIFTPNRTKSAFLKLIYTALNEAWITIPFPQTDLHIKDSIPLKIKLI